MDLEITIDDPKTFTKPFSLKLAKKLEPDTDLIESVCENDRSVPHMLGGNGVRVAPEVLSKYTGTYEFAPGREAAITLEGDLLFLQVGTNPLKLPLVADTDTVFVSRTNGDRIEFVKDAQGSVAAFIFHQGDGDRRAVRKGGAIPDRK